MSKEILLASWENIFLSIKYIIIIILLFIIFFAININAFNGVPLKFSALEFDPYIVKAALFLGADVHIDNDTALQFAALNGRAENVEVLLNHGADARAKQNLALFNAIKSHDVKTVDILLSKGKIKFPCRMGWALFSKNYGTPQIDALIEEKLKDVPICAPITGKMDPIRKSDR
jgi:hypothetical protein